MKLEKAGTTFRLILSFFYSTWYHAQHCIGAAKYLQVKSSQPSQKKQGYFKIQHYPLGPVTIIYIIYDYTRLLYSFFSIFYTLNVIF